MLSATAIFVLFTVLHDAAHYSVSTHRWVNVAFGRVAMLFVSPLISFKSFAFIHIEHHRNTNDDDNDPDHFVSGAPWWQLPFRAPFMDVPYLTFLVRNVRRRPRGEVLETVFRANWSELLEVFRRIEASDEPPLAPVLPWLAEQPVSRRAPIARVAAVTGSPGAPGMLTRSTSTPLIQATSPSSIWCR